MTNAATIAALVEQCSQGFARQVDALETRDLRDLLSKESSRFKIWVGTLSAHRASGYRSLEYRLRDSQNLRTRVLSLLQDLHNELEHFDEDDSDLDQDVDLSDGGTEGFEAGDVHSQGDLYRSLEEVKGIVDLMYRLAMTLQNPAKHSRIRDALSSSAVAYRPYDIRHIQDKYPAADQVLVERLARAVSTWRQYIRYREDHFEKKAAVGTFGDNVTTIATSLPQQQMTPGAEGQDDIGVGRSSTIPALSIYSQTSFAPTTSGSTSLQPPRMPEIGSGGHPFQCEICCDIVSCETEHEWRQTTYLRGCPSLSLPAWCLCKGNKLYSQRREWQRHMLKSHYQAWLCPFDCISQFNEANLLLDHIVTKHRPDQDPAELYGLLNSCAQPNVASLDLHCPLCRYLVDSPRIWFKHVGHHLEELACYALPAKVYGNNPDEESESDDASEPRTREHRRRASVSSDDSLDGQSSEAGHEEDDLTHKVPISKPLLITSILDCESETDPQPLMQMQGRPEGSSASGVQAMPRLDTAFEPFILPYTQPSPTNAVHSTVSVQERTGEEEAAGKFNCAQCDASFSTQAALTHHLRSHRPYQSRNYVCRHCDKGFQYRKDLARHMPRHDPGRPRFYCPHQGCKYNTSGFGRKDNLDRHMASYHRLTSGTMDT